MREWYEHKFVVQSPSLPAISVLSDSQEVGIAAAQKIADVILNKQKEGKGHPSL